MSALSLPCPEPPHFTFDFDELDRTLPFVRALRGCPQDPIWHAEGDVWVHTRMVLESLVALPAFRALPTEQREIAFVAALMHDVAKPLCTREEDGRITSRGHSGRGENLSRRLLWSMNAEPRAREHVSRIIEVHQVPFFAIEREDASRIVHRTSQVVSNHLLALVAEADARGRKAVDRQRLLDNIELFRELSREQECDDRPRAFPSDHARSTYFRSPSQLACYEPFDDTWGEVLVMSGLPAAGKDTWLARHAPELPVVSLDRLRAELHIAPSDPQGPVVSAAREQARTYLRRQQPFAWNATHLSREQRAPVLELLRSYRARVTLVHLEVSPAEQAARNGARQQPVPHAALERMLARWQVPDPTEAQRVLLDGINIPRYT